MSELVTDRVGDDGVGDHLTMKGRQGRRRRSSRRRQRHGNPGDQPAIWLDGRDIPLLRCFLIEHHAARNRARNATLACE